MLTLSLLVIINGIIIPNKPDMTYFNATFTVDSAINL